MSIVSADGPRQDPATALGLEAFIADVARLVGGIDDERELTKRVARQLSTLLAGDFRLPEHLTRPSRDRHVNYPLHIAADSSWSLACVVWNPDQHTPVHSHETWGVAGIYSGVDANCATANRRWMIRARI